MNREAIRVAAVVLTDGEGRVLTVRKRGTRRFMLPGGKPEPAESSLRAALREAEEEIGLRLGPQQVVRLGEFSAAAANEEGRQVVGDVYVVEQRFAPEVLGALRPQAEIEEIRWATPEEIMGDDDVAPLLSTQIVPALLVEQRLDMAQNGTHARTDPTRRPS